MSLAAAKKGARYRAKLARLVDGERRHLVFHADCHAVARAIGDETFDGILTDPPYGLGELRDPAGLVRAWLEDRDGLEATGGRGFMERAWDASVPPPYHWREHLRVTKPGAFAAVFAGARTLDLMSLSMRLAGWEIRDVISWVYSTGCPKGNVKIGRAVDAALGQPRQVVGIGTYARKTASKSAAARGQNRPGARPKFFGPATTDEGARADGYGTKLSPGWEPIILAQRPRSADTWAGQFLGNRCGGLNINACRTPYAGNGDADAVKAKFDSVAHIPKRGQGRVLGSGLGGGAEFSKIGRWPTNLIFSCSPDCDGDRHAEDCPVKDLGDRARFFPTFRYESKPNDAERNAGLDGLPITELKRSNPGGLENDPKWAPRAVENPHPTLKPIRLLRWLARLICPPQPAGALVWTPYAGSGSEMCAIVAEGGRSVGAELDTDNLGLPAIIDARVKWWANHDETDLAIERLAREGQGRLFEGTAT